MAKLLLTVEDDEGEGVYSLQCSNIEGFYLITDHSDDVVVLPAPVAKAIAKAVLKHMGERVNKESPTSETLAADFKKLIADHVEKMGDLPYL